MMCFNINIIVLTKEGSLKIIGSAEDKSTWGRQVRGQERYSHCSHNTNQLTKQINEDSSLGSDRKHEAAELMCDTEREVAFVLHHLLKVHIYMPARADVFIFF